MTDCIRGAVSVALVVLAVAAPGAAAAPVSVNLRVEGATRTIFDGPVTTDGHAIATASSGGAHPCDGTNNGAHPAPLPVATAALDDGARLNGFSWDADWFDSGLNDFAVKEIGGEAQTATQFWGYLVNFTFASVGGCQQQVRQGDEVLWVFDAFNKSNVLRLSGQSAATTGAPVTVQVVDGQDGSPQAGAVVNGTATGGDGRATLSFPDPGVYRLKAERADAVRSNALVLCVDPPGADPCSASDREAPSLRLDQPTGELASERGQSRTTVVSWQADDGTGAGLAHFSVDVRPLARGVGPAPSTTGDWHALQPRTTLTSARFRGDSGATYRFRITAVDRAANRSSVESGPFTLPVDDRDRKLWPFSRGWRRIPAESAWGRTVMRPRRRGASARLRFRGRAVALIGRKLRRGGRLRVSVDGRARVLRLRGRSRPRSVLWQSRTLPDGPHVLRIRWRGGGPVELDAVAPRP